MGVRQLLPLGGLVNERRTIGVLCEPAIDERQYGGDRRQQCAQRGRSARLAEGVSWLEPNIGVRKGAGYLDGGAQAKEAHLLGLPAQRQIQGLVPKIDIAATSDE